MLAAVKLANVPCREGGCAGPWCDAQAGIRKALEGRGIVWRQPDAIAVAPSVLPPPPMVPPHEADIQVD